MIIQKLPWAGIVAKFENTTVLVDPLFNVNVDFFGPPHEAFFPLDSVGPVDAVLITHTHSDHFDPSAIAAFFGDNVPVYLPLQSLESSRSELLKNPYGVQLGERITIGSVQAAATYSVDGLGDPQLAWVIEGEGRRIIHCGDTLWHGYWWTIANEYGPFDVACLPVNGAVIEDPDLTASGQPICMTPEQAVSAAVILGARALIPIHFGAFHYPPQYVQTSNLIERLEAAAASKNINLQILKSQEQYVI